MRKSARLIAKHGGIEEDSCDVPERGTEVSCSMGLGEREVPHKRAKPKQPPSAYMLWLKEEGLQAARLKHPLASPAQLGREAHELWRQIEAEKRNQYKDRFEEARKQWILDCREWREMEGKGCLAEEKDDEIIEPEIRTMVCEDTLCQSTNCGDPAPHGKSELKKEIQKIIKDIDIQRPSSKEIRLQLQENLGINLKSRRKEFDELVIEVFSEQPSTTKEKTVKSKVSAKKKQENKKSAMEEKRRRYEDAANSWMRGENYSVAACARKFGLDRKILHQGIVKRGGKFPGKGNFSSVLSPTEERKVYNHVVHMSEIGNGPSWFSLRLLLKEVLLSMKAVNPNRITGFENTGQMPDLSFTRRFADCHNFTLRKSSVISRARAVVSPQDIALWFSDIDSFLSMKPKLGAALQNPVWFFN